MLKSTPRSYQGYLAHMQINPHLKTQCSICNVPFNEASVRTLYGWQMTQELGLCEDCFGHSCNERLRGFRDEL